MEKGSWVGACSIIPASVTWLLVRPELRNSPNMNRRNISRWRMATNDEDPNIMNLLVVDVVLYGLGDYRSRTEKEPWFMRTWGFQF